MNFAERQSLPALAACAFALFCACQAQSSPLDRALANFRQARLSVDSAKLALAEDFCRKVGDNRFYKHELHLGSYNRANIAHLNGYLNKLRAVRESGDVQAAIEALQAATGASDEQIRAGAEQLVEAKLAPACLDFARALKPVFEGADLEQNRAALEKEIDARGKTEEVQDFIFGWAHFHTCKVLVEADRSVLIRRIPDRVADLRRIQARLEARRLKRQQEAQQA